MIGPPVAAVSFGVQLMTALGLETTMSVVPEPVLIETEPNVDVGVAWNDCACATEPDAASAVASAIPEAESSCLRGAFT